MKITRNFTRENFREFRASPAAGQHRRREKLTIGLETLFSDSIIPQLFVDSELLLRDFTPPLGALFSLGAEDRGRSIYDLKEKIGHRSLIANIRGVIYTERNLEKEVQTADGRWFRLNIQPNFSPEEGEVNGVIITFFQVQGG